MVSGDLIREARRRAGLIQRQLAERAGKAPSVIGRWERGEVKPPLETVVELIRACGLDLGFGMNESDDGHDLALIQSELRRTPASESRPCSISSGSSRPPDQAWRLVSGFRPELILAALERRQVRYDDLVDRLVRINVMSVDVPVAALEDVIRSKEAANRAKDRATLPLLRRTLEEIRRQEGR